MVLISIRTKRKLSNTNWLLARYSTLLLTILSASSTNFIKLINADATLINTRQTNSNHDQNNHSDSETNWNNNYQSRSARLINGDEDANVLEYLQKYGYMNKKQSNTGANNLISEESFTEAIRSFQRFAGINETGLINSETLELMQRPRCGNSDKHETMQHMEDHHHHQNLPPILNGIGANLRRHQQQQQRTKRRRRKRFALQGSKWRRQELTYRISQYPTRFSSKRHEVDAQIEKAFGIWSHVAPIDFVVKRDGKVHIDIRFASGDHGDGDSFDGPGNTLAHAYFPQYGGDAHFDDQEFWTIDSYAGTNIFQVAAHELGHSLGLGHSNVREALMAPFYQKYKPNFKLHMDDILAIQALYGEKQISDVAVPDLIGSTTTTTTPPPSTTSTLTSTINNLLPRGRPVAGASPPITGSGKETNDDEAPLYPDLHGNGLGGGSGSGDDALAFQGAGGPNKYPQAAVPADLCSDSQIDAATRTEDRNSYVFKGNFYWQLTSSGLAKGFPRRISTDWEGLTGPIDAALTWADGKTFFFKGNKYWRYRNKRRDIGYPKLISSGFAGIPDDIDAAFVWSGNGRTYIFKGSQYWRYDSKADPPVSNEYPRSIKIWRGVPSYINAAFKWENNVTYFFKGNQYYRFNDKEFRVESRGRPAFPRPSAEWWFGCQIGSNLAAQRALPTSSSNDLLFYDQQFQSNNREQQATNSEISNFISDYEIDRIADQASSRQPDSLATNGNEWSLLPKDGLSSFNSVMGTHINDGTNIGSDLEPVAGNYPENQLDKKEANPSLPPITTIITSDSTLPNSFRLNGILRPRSFSNPFQKSSSSSTSAISPLLISLTPVISLLMSLPQILHYFIIRKQASKL